MSKLIEVLFGCAANDGQLSCTAWDFRHNTNLMTYKGGGILQPQTFCQIRNEFLICANNARPLLHVWPINSQEQLTATRFVVPGRVNAMALCSKAIYLVAGIAETIYIWNLVTGRMLNTISKHYQTINCLRFTSDDSHFVSAGRDGSVLVWNLTRVVTRDTDINQTPLYSFNDHGLPVTDVQIGIGGIRAFMATVSLDRTCKVYDLSNGTLLLSVIFTEALKCLKFNGLETCYYVGTSEGNIYEFHTNAPPRTKEYHIEKDFTNTFKGHKDGTAVNCLVLSADGHTLISGGDDSQVIIWNISSRQVISTIDNHKGAITNLQLFLTDSTIFYPEHKPPNIFMSNLRRMIDPPEADDNEIIEVRNNEPLILFNDWEVEEETQYKINNDNVLNSSMTPTSDTLNDSANETIQQLKDEIEKLKAKNKELFAMSAKCLLKEKNRNKSKIREKLTMLNKLADKK